MPAKFTHSTVLFACYPQNADTISLNSVLSTSGEFGQSGMEIARSGEWSQSAEMSPTTGSPLESWEAGSQDRTSSSFPSTSRAKLMKMKDRLADMILTFKPYM